jgi:hypothetical protein
MAASENGVEKERFQVAICINLKKFTYLVESFRGSQTWHQYHFFEIGSLPQDVNFDFIVQKHTDEMAKEKCIGVLSSALSTLRCYNNANPRTKLIDSLDAVDFVLDRGSILERLASSSTLLSYLPNFTIVRSEGDLSQFLRDTPLNFPLFYKPTISCGKPAFFCDLLAIFMRRLRNPGLTFSGYRVFA